MKKVISIFLAALMLCSLFVITAGAEIYDEDFTPGVVVAGIEFDAPSIETLLKDFEIEEATETGASCVHNTYLVKFKEKTKEIVLRAVEVLEKSSYVLYAAPEYIYQEVGSTEPVTSEPVTEKPSDSAEIYDEDFTPGVVVVGVEFDAPAIETLLKDFEIEEVNETGASCVHNTYLVKFKDKTKGIVLRAIEELEKSSYVLYAAPDYIYQEEGSTEPISSEPVVTTPSETTFEVTESYVTTPIVTKPIATPPVGTDPTQPATAAPIIKNMQANSIKITAKAKSVKANKLKNKKQTVKPLTIKNAQGAVTVSKVKNGTNKKIFKKITINNKTGAITFKKGKYVKKTYKIKLKITAAGNADYNAKTVTQVVKIKVK